MSSLRVCIPYHVANYYIQGEREVVIMDSIPPPAHLETAVQADPATLSPLAEVLMSSMPLEALPFVDPLASVEQELYIIRQATSLHSPCLIANRIGS